MLWLVGLLVSETSLSWMQNHEGFFPSNGFHFSVCLLMKQIGELLSFFRRFNFIYQAFLQLLSMQYDCSFKVLSAVVFGPFIKQQLL